MLVEVKDLVSHIVSTATVEAGVPLFACGMTLPALKFAFFDTARQESCGSSSQPPEGKSLGSSRLAFAVMLEAMVLFVMFGWCTVGIVHFFPILLSFSCL